MPDRQPLLVTAEERDALAKWLRQGQNIRGTGVRVSPDGLQFNIPQGGSLGNVASSANGARVFKLVEDGSGSSGDKDNPCTFKYDVHDPDTDELIEEGVALTGRGRRDDVGKMKAAQWGMGDVDADGNVRLVFADEANFRRDCVPPP
jgi:hypothetical protein